MKCIFIEGLSCWTVLPACYVLIFHSFSALLSGNNYFLALFTSSYMYIVHKGAVLAWPAAAADLLASNSIGHM